jgi:hypothetical protein
MDGVYFEQGMIAAKQATSWADCSRLNPYGADTPRGRTWANGFCYKFHSPSNVTSILLRYIPSGRVAAPLAA